MTECYYISELMMAATTKKIERGSPVPLYYQLKQILSDKIDDGAWHPGDVIPGEHELQSLYGLSRTTVRQALRELEAEGRVIRQRGRGTFVSAPKLTHEPDTSHGLTESIAASGMKAGWRVLSTNRVGASTEVAERLGIQTGDQVYRVQRLRMADEQPLAVHVAHVAPAFIDRISEDLLAAGGSLHYLTGDGQLEGYRTQRLIEAVAADREISALLGISAGVPMLQIRRLTLAADGQPIEDFVGTYRGDRFQYRIVGGAALKV